MTVGSGGADLVVDRDVFHGAPAAAGGEHIGRFRLLDGERVIQTLAVDTLRVTLTGRRVLVNGQDKRLLFFPGASTSRAAMTRDVSLTSAGSRFLPDWIALIGAGLVLTALFQGLRDNLIWLIIGATAMAIWYFVRTDVLELSVEGRPLVTIPTRSTDPEVARSMDAFVDALFALKAGTG